MKSLLVCVFWPAWEWTKKPGERYLFASYSDALSMRDSVRCRNILTSDWYQDKWPMKFRDDQNAKGMFENTLGGWRLATSVGGRGTGLHPGRVICDDGNSAAAAESEAERQNVIDWWDGTISTRGISRGVAQVVIQQRLHTQDMTGHLLGKDGWEHICLPMRFEPGRMQPTSLGFQDPRTVDGQLLWPELFTEEIVSKLEKTMGLYNAAGQLQQRPVPRGGGMFKREWFRVVEAAPQCRRLVRYWDKAGTEGKGARTAGVLMGLTHEGSYVVLDVLKDQLGAVAREALIKQTAVLDAHRYDNRVTTICECEPGSGGKESAEATVRNLAGFDCQIDRVTGSKQVRAEPIAAQASVGNVMVLRGNWTSEFLDEIEVFPLGKFKDQCFVAGTLITTARGDIPIEQITTKDQVLTRKGYYPVQACGLTSSCAEVVTITFSDGRTLIGTANHPIWIQGKGFIPIDSTSGGDTIEICNLKKSRSSLMGRFIRDTLTPVDLGRGITTGLRVAGCCTKTYGRSTMESLKQAWTSIILTLTPSITTYRTWPVCLQVSTSVFTLKQTGKGSACENLQRRGITRRQRMRLAFGQENIRGQSEKRWSLPASSVEKTTWATPLARMGTRFAHRFAQISNVLKKSVSTFRSFALFVVSPLLAGPQLRDVQSPVLLQSVSSPSKIGRPVYNLSVSEVPEYFANGVLVHNCDAASGAFNKLCEASGAFSSVEKELPTMARDVGEHCFATGEDSFYSTEEPGSFLN